MRILCVAFVFFGAIIMFFSIIKYYRSLAELKKQTGAKSLYSDWIYLACMIMMVFFQIGYCAIIVLYTYNATVTTIDLLISLIFMFGAVFVFAMVTMTQRMFNAMNDKEILNEQLNQLKRMENELILAKELAEQGNRAKSEFLSRMSHEMRTPMNAITGMTSIGLTTHDAGQKNYCMSRIQTASASLLELINNILDMSKIETYNLELIRKNFIFRDAIKHSIDGLKHKIDDKKLIFTLSIDKDVPIKINTDEYRLNQVIVNILSNSIKFTDENGEISLDVRKIRDDGEHAVIEFKIKDSGIGMTEEERDKIFVPFEQVDGSITRKFGGVGLGLAITRRIVEMMDGDIMAESVVGQGTVFVFQVKVKVVSEASKDEKINTDSDGGDVAFCFDLSKSRHNENPPCDVSVAEGCFSGSRILAAEDIEINREVIDALLEKTGAIIDFAYNGRMVCEMLAKNPQAFDVILMDVDLPDMNGFEAASMIRALNSEHAKTVPIIAMTADTLGVDVEKSLLSGMNDFVGKPLNAATVLEKLSKYLRPALANSNIFVGSSGGAT